MFEKEKIYQFLKNEEIYIPSYFQDVNNYIHLTMDLIREKQGNENDNYLLIWDYWREYKKIMNSFKFKYILLEGEIVGINDYITINTRFGNKYNVIVKEINGYYDGKYNIATEIGNDLKREFQLENNILLVGASFSGTKTNSEINFDEYLENIILYSNPFPLVDISNYYKDKNILLYQDNIIDSLHEIITKIQNLLLNIYKKI